MSNLIFRIAKIDQSDLSAISEFLSILVNETQTEGAIIWELDKNTSQLYVVADTFISEVHPPLLLTPSITGTAILEKRPIYVPDIHNNIFSYSPTFFWNNKEINSFFIVPITFTNGEVGAINIYSKYKDGFSETKRSEIFQCVEIFPNWYCSLLDRATYNLIKRIEKILENADSKLTVEIVSKKDMCLYIQEACVEIVNVFKCLDSSVVLKDVVEKDFLEYERVAATWSYQDSRQIYRASQDDGLTGWILCNKKAVLIADLNQFENEGQYLLLQKEYPGIQYQLSNELKKEYLRKIEITDDEFMPPFGFIGVPILVGEDLVGVIRCCGPLSNPYYFGKREVEILKLVASRLGEIWYKWMQYTSFRKITKSWEDIISFTGRFDGFVLDELAKDNSDINKIFASALQEIPNLFSNAEILDIRLVNSEAENAKPFLEFHTVYGNAWNTGSDEEKKKRLSKKFILDEKIANSIGADVYNNKKTKVLDPVNPEDSKYDATFIQTTRMIVAPLIIRDKVLGVLDVRSTQDTKFSQNAPQAISLIAQQLAVYYELVETSNKFKSDKADQQKIFQTLVHQFRNPINHASTYSRQLQQEFRKLGLAKNVKIENHINAVAGLCNKAYTVVANLEFFIDLIKRNPIRIKKSIINSGTILRLLKQSAMDIYSLNNPAHKKVIHIDEESFYILDEIYTEFDRNMLEQLVDILFDNAIKYSYHNTLIKVYGEFKEGVFHLVISNIGIPISGREVTLAKARGWRSKTAEMVTPYGNGIGLWVLDNMVRAHYGTFEIEPTNEEGETIIRVIFSRKLYHK